MRNIDPSLTADSSDAEKFAAFAEGVIKGTVSAKYISAFRSIRFLSDFRYNRLSPIFLFGSNRFVISVTNAFLCSQIENFHFTPQAQKMKIRDFPYDINAQVI